MRRIDRLQLAIQQEFSNKKVVVTHHLIEYFTDSNGNTKYIARKHGTSSGGCTIYDDKAEAEEAILKAEFPQGYDEEMTDYIFFLFPAQGHQRQCNP